MIAHSPERKSCRDTVADRPGLVAQCLTHRVPGRIIVETVGGTDQIVQCANRAGVERQGAPAGQCRGVEVPLRGLAMAQ